MLICVLGAWATINADAGEEIPRAAKEVRAEAVRKNQDPDGRPLPMAAHWHASNFPLTLQIELIRRGHHIFPFTEWPQGGGEISGFRTLADWNMPFATIHGLQWVMPFYRSDRYEKMPVDQTGCAVDPDGERLDMISPFSPVQPWEDLGREWTTGEGVKRLQEIYPDPPLVILAGNNEPSALEWEDVEKSGRYLDRYGRGRSDVFKRRVVGDGWIKRYRAMFRGMREGLTKEEWQANARFVGYGAFGPDHFGRWGGWKAHSLVTPQRLDPSWHAWGGGMGSYYDNDWEGRKTMFNVWSCQVEFMNHVFMKQRALEVNPTFWYEVIYWDGGKGKAEQYEKKGFEPTGPERYRGWVQFGMWLLTPRVAREWESSTTSREKYWHKMKEIIRAVDLVYADPVLERFWRRGRLVHNRAHRHPFQANVPEKWQDVHRWFLLDTSLDPERPWDVTTHLPVFSLARVIGEKPEREWLLYAHAPLGDKEGVRITIPDYGKVTVDVDLGGSFYLVSEKDESVRQVGHLSQVQEAPVNISTE